MITLTKIFHFEMAHAIYGYTGACKNIHGHSYELQVTVTATDPHTTYIDAPGFLIDFKVLKMLVNESVINILDHRIVLSAAYLTANPAFTNLPNLLIFEAEPTAENLLLFISRKLQPQLPENISLSHLKLFETKDSYAEWRQTA